MARPARQIGSSPSSWRFNLAALAALTSGTLALAGCGKGDDVSPGMGPASDAGGAPAGRSGGASGGRTGGGGAPGAGGQGPAGSGGATSAGGTAGATPTGGSAGSAAGGSAGSDAGAGTDMAPVDIHAVPALPPRRDGYKVFHSSNVSMWEIADVAVYDQYKANFDEVIGILERGYFAIESRLGQQHDRPIRVIIEKGGCCGGFAGGGDVGYSDGDFMDDGAMDWVRGVVLGEVVNGVTGAVSSDWPRDWWADTAWYFPGFVTVDVLKEVVPAHAMKWETTEKYPTYPVYVLYKALLEEKGWDVYRKLFASIKTDKIDWSKIGANPSALKTNYVIAYVSLAAGANLGDRFKAAKIAGADPTAVGAIMDAHAKLVTAGTNAAGWTKFRNGDYAGAAAGL